MLSIKCHQIDIEAHWSIKKIEKYYIYNIICAET